MPVDQKTREALDLRKLHLPPDPPVTGVEVEEYTDSSGEEALRVRVILDESVSEKSLTGDAVLKIKSAIRESLRSHGISYFAYIFLTKESERRPEPTED